MSMIKILNTIRKLTREGFKTSSSFFQISVIVLLLTLAACGEQEESAEGHDHSEMATYTCPMHPQIVEKEPGSCPICGMDLVRQSVEGGEIEVTDDLSLLLEPANQSIVSDIRTVHPVEEQKTIVSSFPGVVAYDTRQTYSVPVRVGGRIEKLYVSYNFQPVEKGQKLLEIYSPELLTAQRELLFLVNNDADNGSLIEAARQKLRLMGVSQAQINQLIQSGREQYSFPVFSPYKGYIVETPLISQQEERKNAPTASGMGGGGMGAGMGSGGRMSQAGPAATTGAAVPGNSAALNLREGMYVQAGQSLFSIIDASRLWAEFNVSAAEAAFIEEGNLLQISWGPGEQQQLQAKVDLIQPFFSQGENFSKLRVYLQDSPLRAGQLVEGEVKTTTTPALWVPALAVLDVGNRKLVFVKQGGVLRPREVVTGIRAGEMTEIKEGISKEEEVAHNAQFLIDSEGVVEPEI